MKPDIIARIENETGRQLNRVTGLKNPVDAMRNKHNHSYALEDGKLVALNVSATESLTRIEFDEAVCAHLRYLNLSENNHLTAVSFSGPMPRLEYLDLSECKLRELVLPVGCDRLEKAWLQKNELGEVRFAGPCPELQLLDLSNNRMQELSLPAGFDSLAWLYLVNCRLQQLHFEHHPDDNRGPEELQFITPLPRLETLHLQGNRLEYAPENIVFTGTLTALYLAGNAPRNIPKVLLGSERNFSAESCLENARIWFTEIRDHPHEENEVVKLMLTGNSGVGKSTLAYSMKNGHCEIDPDPTHGVLIYDLPFDDIPYNVWDFGGQEIYHGTHRLFLTSAALQVIVFDTETEKTAELFQPVPDRACKKRQVMNHPVEYWYETTRKLSPGSQFFIVQNKKKKGEKGDAAINQFALDKADFIQLNAKTGNNLGKLSDNLKREAWKLPDYHMVMPQSWLKVRQFFIDNLGTENNIKIIEKKDFEKLCEENRVMEQARPLLFEYLHHNGFLYRHDNMGDKIIADQRWALNAIYKPYDRKADHYQEFLDQHGKIRVWKLFQVFGDDGTYTVEQKWLFLDFMKSCGLCFQLNNKPWQESKDESDVYVFPEFLPDVKPDEVARFWDANAREVHVLRYRLPWLNYYVIQSFIAALGRKTETGNFWHYGIQVCTPKGWFEVELDYAPKPALLLHIEKCAMAEWLSPVLEELSSSHGNEGWEISANGREFEPFDAKAWSEKAPRIPADGEIQRGEAAERKSVKEICVDVPQDVGREVILFLAANPTTEKLSLRREHSHIAEKLSEKGIRDKIELLPRFDTSPDRMADDIQDCTPTIVHFVGHGEKVNKITGKGGGLILNADDFQGEHELDAEKLGKMFRLLKQSVPQLKIVFLNACYSEPQAIAISQQDIYTIGANDVLSSKAARLFAGSFYRRYTLTTDIIKAFRSGMISATSEDRDIEQLVHLYHNGQRIDS